MAFGVDTGNRDNAALWGRPHQRPGGNRARVRGQGLILGSPAPHPGCPQPAPAGVGSVVPRQEPGGAGRKCTLRPHPGPRASEKGPQAGVRPGLGGAEFHRVLRGHGPCWNPAMCAHSHHTAFTQRARYGSPKRYKFSKSPHPRRLRHSPRAGDTLLLAGLGGRRRGLRRGLLGTRG